jgi:hypothetical protein
MVCFGSARNPNHVTCDCPILKNLGFKLEKRSGSDTSARDVASRVATDASLAQAGPTTPAPAPAPPADTQPNTALVPGAFRASTKQESYDYGDEFDFKGKADNAWYNTGGKPNASSPYSTPSCRNVTFEPASSSDAALATASTTPFDLSMGGPTASSKSTMDPRGVNTIYLPKTVLALLNNPPPSQLSAHGVMSGRLPYSLPTPEPLAICYWINQRSSLIILSWAGASGWVTICLLPSLDTAQPLSLSMARRFSTAIAYMYPTYATSFTAFGPISIKKDAVSLACMVLACHLNYAPIGQTCGLPDLVYVQPKFLTIKSTLAMATSLDHAPATIEPDDEESNVSPTFVSHWPKRPPSPHYLPLDLSRLPPSTYTKNLKDLDKDKLIQRLHSFEVNTPLPNVLPHKGKSPVPLVCMKHDNIIAHLNHLNTTPPAVCPCNTPNPLDTKSTWTAEELNCITGCCHFRNYKHLIQSTKDGLFVDNGEFPASIGAYATILRQAHRLHTIQIS